MHGGKSPFLQQRIGDLRRKVVGHGTDHIAQIAHPTIRRSLIGLTAQVGRALVLILFATQMFVVQAENVDGLRVGRASQKMTARRKAQAVNGGSPFQAPSQFVDFGAVTHVKDADHSAFVRGGGHAVSQRGKLDGSKLTGVCRNHRPGGLEYVIFEKY